MNFTKRSFPFYCVILFLLFTVSTTYSNPKPKLEVIIVVDQMRYDYLIRFAGLYDGGFAKLMNEGAYFTEAYHDHANTSTAPGHATIATGSFPWKNGIVSNDYFEQSSKSVVYACSDSTSKILGHPEMEGISPRRLLRNGISDWIKNSNSKSKVYCVSIKDRPSVMMGGKKPDGIFWYEESTGKYVSSEYYMNKLPFWVDLFNESGIVYKHLNDDWTKLYNEDTYLLSREDDFPNENNRIGRTFPHNLRTKNNKDEKSVFRQSIMFSPFGEEMNFAFAKTIIENENMGSDNNPDLLFVGCSSADKLGHDFGPLSQEMEDYYLRLDKYIGDFIEYLDKKVGKENYIIALSADHGALTMPEELRRRNYDAQRIPSSEVKKEYEKAAEETQKRFGLSNNIMRKITSTGIALYYEEAESKNISQADLRKALAENLKKINFIADTYTIEDFHDKNEKEFLQNYKECFMLERSYEINIRLKKYYMVSSDIYGSTHGSPYDYDSHVPIIFYGSGIKHCRINEKVLTVDIAPTLAEILGIKYDKDVDGKNLLEMIKEK